MTQDDLKLWLLDTLSDGGYSLGEMLQLFKRNCIRVEKFTSCLIDAFDNNLIEIYKIEDNSIVAIEYREQVNIIHRYLDIANKELKTSSKHFLCVTDVGNKYLMDHGIYS